jgi:hypothetical protein
MAFQRLNIRHGTRIIVGALTDVFMPEPPDSFPAATAIRRIRKLSRTETATITQEEIALINGVSMSQLSSGNCDAFDSEKAVFWSHILDEAESFWNDASLYPVIHGLKPDGTPDPEGKKLPFTRAKFSQPTMICSTTDSTDTNCREVILALVNLWKAAQV